MIKILKHHPFILVFGMLQVFFSAPGQTFLVAFFVGHIFRDLGLSLSSFAGLYSAATLLASLLLNPAGRLIDRHKIRHIVMAITFLFAAGCVLLACAQNIVMVFISFFILRLIGQGVFGLTASTLIIKKFQKNRGTAIGIIMLGFPLSEVVYPAVALVLLEYLGWRGTYIVFGLSTILVMLPLQIFLLARSRLRRGHFLEGEALINPQTLPGNPQKRVIRQHRDCTLKEVTRDVKFYLLLLASCAPPLVVTGLFFHQDPLFASHGWPISLAATGLGLYALCKAIGSVAIGPLVDRVGPLGPFIAIIVMLGFGPLLAAVVTAKWAVYAYYAIIGAALGFSSPVMNVVWPHFYGIKYIGSIKGFIATFRNGFTAFGPLPIAIALESGATINQVLLWMAAGTFLIATFPLIVWRMQR